ncbi:MAG: tetratricopeptide repeat protein [Planctomycetes bacterium]|nr:tetratricopeptide repeat protein [Planctomycetota bacterium]
MSLLHAFAGACETARSRALTFLAQGQAATALRFAQRTYALCPEEASLRLLAVCYLANGDPSSAARLARSVDR